MSITPPRLKQRKNGLFYCNWGGRFISLGRDPLIAADRIREEESAWAAWRNQKLLDRQARPRRHRPVHELIEEFLDDKFTDSGAGAERYYRCHLARFLAAYSLVPLSAIDARKVTALKADMADAEYAPKTINHDVGAVRSFLQWAWDRYPGIARPWNLRSATKVKLPPRPSKARPIDFVARYILLHEAFDPALGPWLRLQFLCGLRPAELPRLVHRSGKWHRPDLGASVYAVPSKCGPRFIVLTPEALSWLAVARPVWKHADGFAAAIRRAWEGPKAIATIASALGIPLDPLKRSLALPGFPCHFLRHSAYQHLLDSGLDFATARLLMGHKVGGSWAEYAQAPWHAWIRHMSALSLEHLESRLKIALPLGMVRPGAAFVGSRRPRNTLGGVAFGPSHPPVDAVR